MMKEYQFPAPERTLKQKKERRKEFLIIIKTPAH